MKKIMIIGLIKLTLLFSFLIIAFTMFGGFDDRVSKNYSGQHLWFSPNHMSFAIDIGRNQVLLFEVRNTEKYYGYDRSLDQARKLKKHIVKDSKFFTSGSVNLILYDMLYLRESINPRKSGTATLQFTRSDLPAKPALFDKEQNWPYSTELIYNSPKVIERKTFDQEYLKNYTEHYQIPMETHYSLFKVRSIGRRHSGP